MRFVTKVAARPHVRVADNPPIRPNRTKTTEPDRMGAMFAFRASLSRPSFREVSSMRLLNFLIFALGCTLVLVTPCLEPCLARQEHSRGLTSARAGFAVYRSARSTQEEETTLEWRHDGSNWQQIPIAKPVLIHRINLPYRVPVVHPIRFATLVLLFVMMAVTWSSDEWQWGRLVQDRLQDDEP
ncbi:MAG: hypothetical protein ACR2NP_16175 [Pirellulaceae bacterium]